MQQRIDRIAWRQENLPPSELTEEDGFIVDYWRLDPPDNRQDQTGGGGVYVPRHAAKAQTSETPQNSGAYIPRHAAKQHSGYTKRFNPNYIPRHAAKT
jgi:hypothetical protein